MIALNGISRRSIPVFDPPYSVGDLAHLIDMDKRSIQFWAQREVIRPTADSKGGGRGVPLMFDRSETCIAAIIAPMARAGIKIKALNTVALGSRDAFSAPDSWRQYRRAIELAIQGEPNNYLIVGLGSPGSEFMTEESVVWFSAHNTEMGSYGASLEANNNLPARFIFLINLTSAFSGFRR
jgi:hypothetical protein